MIIYTNNVYVLVAQSCPTLCNPMDYILPGSSVHGDSPGKNTGVGCHALLQGHDNALIKSQEMEKRIKRLLAQALLLLFYLQISLNNSLLGYVECLKIGFPFQ